MVVASLKSLLQRGHVMHAASFSLFTFSTCPIVVVIIFTSTKTQQKPVRTLRNTQKRSLLISWIYSRTPHGACHQYAMRFSLVLDDKQTKSSAQWTFSFSGLFGEREKATTGERNYKDSEYSTWVLLDWDNGNGFNDLFEAENIVANKKITPWKVKK